MAGEEPPLLVDPKGNPELFTDVPKLEVLSFGPKLLGDVESPLLLEPKGEPDLLAERRNLMCCY